MPLHGQRPLLCCDPSNTAVPLGGGGLAWWVVTRPKFDGSHFVAAANSGIMPLVGDCASHCAFASLPQHWPCNTIFLFGRLSPRTSTGSAPLFWVPTFLFVRQRSAATGRPLPRPRPVRGGHPGGGPAGPHPPPPPQGPPDPPGPGPRATPLAGSPGPHRGLGLGPCVQREPLPPPPRLRVRAIPFIVQGVYGHTATPGE